MIASWRLWAGAAIIATAPTFMVTAFFPDALDTLKDWRDRHTQGVYGLLVVIWALFTVVIRLTYHPWRLPE
jgi:hypothetical protein